MKNFLSIIFVSLISTISFGQAPQALNYQAVARTAQGQIIPAQNVNVRFSILDGSITGTSIYQETQSATTNNFGLFTLAIGKGTVVSGTFSTINWGTGNKFLKVEIAADGSGNFQLQGTTQLLSVPYSLYSESTRLVAGNAINITNGNTISAAYQAGVGINITGALISHDLKAGQGIRINQDTIAGNYLPGTGININGNTISGNYIPGSGININGNIISATGGTNFWQPDANGIYYSAGNAGIGGNSLPLTALTLYQTNAFGTGVGLEVTSANAWQTAVTMENNTLPVPNNRFSLCLGGTGNLEVHPNNWGIFNHVGNKWALIINGPSNSVGIGMLNIQSEQIKSKLHVFGGDVNIDQIGSGIIMKSPNGSCWRITIDNAGNLVRTAIACP